MRLMMSGAAWLLALSTSAALSADATSTAQPAAGFVWTGGYVGLQAGHAWGDSTYDVDTTTAFIPYNPDGWFGGIFAGYNYQISNGVVVGVEGDINFAGIESGRTGGVSPGPTPGVSGNAEINWQGSIRGRLGHGFERFLPYITAGVAFAGLDHSITSSFGAQFSDTYVGWTAGVGLEYALANNITARIEYRYADYGDKKYPVTNTFFEHTTDLSTQDVRLGIAYKF